MSRPLDSREFKLILKPKIFQVQIDKEIEMLNDKFIHDSDLKLNSEEPTTWIQVISDQNRKISF
ncbi:MAG TPA: hypothetical protein VLA74_14595 [Nitrososphaeraceae archaeon]|jgi:hypothetical protein|nr:hypothetical protein [Nitrososphaeraceae archaeon]HSF51984.1 hypothetical protein [Nitrososphaeraceae archaeon]